MPPGSGYQAEDIIAYLHCEIPTAGKPAPAAASAGTVDLAEIDSDSPTMRETIPIFEGQAYRVGRARANDLVIDNPSVSRFHAVFSASKTGVVLSDLSSLNGTHLRGRRITTPMDVSSGDVASIGNVKITIELCRGTSAVPGTPEPETLDSTHNAKMSSVLVTVLVADVEGFTKMSQSVPPQEVAEILNLWFRKVGDAIATHGGEIDKYIGDCVMALWRSKPDQAEATAVKAVIAAEAILKETEKLARSGSWAYEDRFPWRCRVALNTGEALMGALGSAGSRDYTVLGDTVNVAFRLETLASDQGSALVISEPSAKLVGDHLPLKSLGHVILDGRKDNMEIFTLDREK